MKNLKKIEFIKGISKKSGRGYYRVDLYFETVNEKEYRKSFFLNAREVNFLGLKQYFKEQN